MSTKVEPEEVQAILDALRPGAAGAGAGREVAQRDFGRPLRISPGQLRDIQRRLQPALVACEKELGRTLRGACALELVEIAEVSAEGLYEEIAQPFGLLRFQVAGQTGWARWDIPGALCAIETVLGSSSAPGTERELTGVERGVLQRLLGGLASRLGEALGLALERVTVVEKREQVGAWSDDGAGADRQRLRLHLSCTGPGLAGAIDLHLPGVLGDPGGPREQPSNELPAHLSGVGLELSARLGAADLPFGELLRLEEGDVIPLSTPLDGLLSVLVEDIECACARMGRSEGRLAIRIESTGPTHDEDR